MLGIVRLRQALRQFEFLGGFPTLFGSRAPCASVESQIAATAAIRLHESDQWGRKSVATANGPIYVRTRLRPDRLAS